MGEGLLVRKGGVAVERTTAPSINFVSKSQTEIVVTFTNNDAAEAEVYYGITSTLTDTVTLAAATTSSNITFSGLDEQTAFTVSAYALVTDPISRKIKSEIVSMVITTNEIPAPTITLVSKTDTSVTFTLKNNSVETRDVTFGLTTPPTTTTITLAAAATSGNQTFSNLDDDTTFTIFAQATDGIIGQLSVTTDPAPIFTAATGGTTLQYNSGGKRFRSHTFTSNGNFVVSTVGDNVDGRNKLDYLIIAGGGGGGGSCCSSLAGGGAGAGGYQTTVGTSGRNTAARPQVNANVQTYSISIGGGGSSGSGAGTNGGNSSALGITASGGGFGGGVGGTGGNGGSGGGSCGHQNNFVNIGVGNGLANQGFNGALGRGSVGNSSCSGGPGGGAGSQPNDNTFTGNNPNFETNVAAPGNGLNNIIRTNSNENRARGGFGGRSNDTVAKPGGAANTGNGGGSSAGGARNGTAGGSGIVVIRYQIAPN